VVKRRRSENRGEGAALERKRLGVGLPHSTFAMPAASSRPRAIISPERSTPTDRCRGCGAYSDAGAAADIDQPVGRRERERVDGCLLRGREPTRHPIAVIPRAQRSKCVRLDAFFEAALVAVTTAPIVRSGASGCASAVATCRPFTALCVP
jgi:hypothetical protein